MNWAASCAFGLRTATGGSANAPAAPSSADGA